MAIPDYQSFMLPLLKELAHGKPVALKIMKERLADHFGLTDEERQQRVQSGSSLILGHRVGWARTYLRKAGLIDLPTRGFMQITDRGLNTLNERPEQIDNAYLKRYPEFIDFISPKKDEMGPGPVSTLSQIDPNTPEELLEEAFSRITNSLSTDLLAKVQSLSWMEFEQLVVKLLVGMGYGGSVKDAGNALMKSGDEGIDGTIKEDRLGLDVIYIQAKKWQAGNTVGRPEIQKFVGALAGQGAKKGVFITTSTFTKDARDYTPRNDTKVVLIDGLQLAQLMIDHDLGVTTERTYVVKRIDSDFFGEE